MSASDATTVSQRKINALTCFIQTVQTKYQNGDFLYLPTHLPAPNLAIVINTNQTIL